MKQHPSVFDIQRLLRAFLHTFPTASAQGTRLRIVTIPAVKITALYKDGGPVTRTVDCAERNDLIHRDSSLKLISHVRLLFSDPDKLTALHHWRSRLI